MESTNIEDVERKVMEFVKEEFRIARDARNVAYQEIRPVLQGVHLIERRRKQLEEELQALDWLRITVSAMRERIQRLEELFPNDVVLQQVQKQYPIPEPPPMDLNPADSAPEDPEEQ